MKKSNAIPSLTVTLVLMLRATAAWAVVFHEYALPPDNASLGLTQGTVAAGDFNGDRVMDVAVAGQAGDQPVLALYQGNSAASGPLRYSLTQELPGVSQANLSWGDFDNDGRIDLLVLGRASGTNTTQLYHNLDGRRFELVANTGLPAITGAAAWGDYDGDGDLDLVLAGMDSAGQVLTRINRNTLNDEGRRVFVWDSEASPDPFLPGDRAAILDPVLDGSVAWGDMDHDGHLDLVLTGTSYRPGTENREVLKVYRNRGDGRFKEFFAVDGVRHGQALWMDLDNDGFLDLAVAGASRLAPEGWVRTFYYRIENKIPTFRSDNSLAGGNFQFATLVAGDLDNDGAVDLIVNGWGQDASSATLTVFTNRAGQLIKDLEGTTALAEAAFYEGGMALGQSLFSASPARSLDLLCLGADRQNRPMARLFINQSAEPPFPWHPGNLRNEIDPADQGIVFRWTPADDVLRSGAARTYNLWVGTSPEGMQVVSPMSAPNDVNQRGSRLIPAAGNAGNRTEWKLVGAALRPGDTIYWAVEALDAGYRSSGFTLANGGYQRYIVPHLARTWQAAEGYRAYRSAWGDLDNDGDLDLAVAAIQGATNLTLVYLNQGGALVPRLPSLTLPGAGDGSVEWGDYDLDGYLDLLIAGPNPTGLAIARNLRDGTFQIDAAAIGALNPGALAGGCAAWGDFDHDGDLDILFAGGDARAARVGLLRNDGPGQAGNDSGVRIFTAITVDGLFPVGHGARVAWADYDKDGRLDFALAGAGWINGQEVRRAVVYHNTGPIAGQPNQWGFVAEPDLQGVDEAMLRWADADNDGFPDLLVAGHAYAGRDQSVILLYLNRPDPGNPDRRILKESSLVDAAIFGEVHSAFRGDAAWGDLDNDGWLDLVITGQSYTEPTSHATVYLNRRTATGDIRFQRLATASSGNPIDPSDGDLPALSSSTVALGDYDGDGRLDLFLAGEGTPSHAGLYHNQFRVDPNLPPSPPSAPEVRYDADLRQATVSWLSALDPGLATAQTPVAALTYNLFLASSTDFLVSPHARIDLPAAGLRRIVAPGNAGAMTLWTLSDFAPRLGEVYHIGVQAIDNSFAGSAFSDTALSFSGAIAGTKFHDLNANGLFDKGEPGLSGWRFYLDTNNNGLFDQGEPTTVSGAEGRYRFEIVQPGSFQVREVHQAGWRQTTPDLAPVRMDTCLVVDHQDIGNLQLASIVGVKFHDANGNGRRDPQEPVLTGVEVFLDNNHDGIHQPEELLDRTDAAGRYAFANLEPGDWRVAENLPAAPAGASWVQTYPSGSTGSPYHEVHLAPGDHAELDFGNYLPGGARGRIDGILWLDANRNGVRDAQEPGLEGWTIFFDANRNGILDPGEIHTESFETGKYTFSNLLIGVYALAVEKKRNSWVQTWPEKGPYVVNLTLDDNRSGIDFGWAPQPEPDAVFGSLQRKSNRQFQFQLRLNLAGTYLVETSTNLKEWTAIKSLPPVTEPVTLDVIDEDAPDHAQRFYRVRKP